MRSQPSTSPRLGEKVLSDAIMASPFASGTDLALHDNVMLVRFLTDLVSPSSMERPRPASHGCGAVACKLPSHASCACMRYRDSFLAICTQCLHLLCWTTLQHTAILGWVHSPDAVCLVPGVMRMWMGALQRMITL